MICSIWKKKPDMFLEKIISLGHLISFSRTFFSSFNQSKHSSATSTVKLCSDWLEDEYLEGWKFCHTIIQACTEKKADILPMIGYNPVEFIRNVLIHTL